MSALRRPGAVGWEAGLSYGYYGVEPLGSRAQAGGQEPLQHWGQQVPAGYYHQQQPQEMGNGWGDPGRARGQQEQAYPGYNPAYWNTSAPTRPSYPSTYPVGPEMQGQGMESYTNGGYGSPYTHGPAGAINHPYTNIHPSNPFYSSGHPQAMYSTEPTSVYKSAGSVPASATQWSYPAHQSCHDCSVHRGQVPGYSAFSTHQTAAMPAPHYTYAETNHSVPQQAPPQPRTQDETWGHQGAYGMPQPPQPPQHYWPAASTASHVVPGNPFVQGSASSWSGNGVAPTSYDAKEPSYPSSYSKPEQVTNHSGYYPEPGSYNTRTVQENKPTPVNPKSHYSASPQLYEDGPEKEPVNEDDGPNSVNSSSSDNLGCHPAIQKIIQVLEKVQFLDNEVEEFVGKKTDKSYKCLEELLTKELLELDSVETMGLDSIRQVRKEAVRKLQAILEKLERKGL